MFEPGIDPHVATAEHGLQSVLPDGYVVASAVQQFLPDPHEEAAAKNDPPGRNGVLPRKPAKQRQKPAKNDQQYRSGEHSHVLPGFGKAAIKEECGAYRCNENDRRPKHCPAVRPQARNQVLGFLSTCLRSDGGRHGSFIP